MWSLSSQQYTADVITVYYDTSAWKFYSDECKVYRPSEASYYLRAVLISDFEGLLLKGTNFNTIVKMTEWIEIIELKSFTYTLFGVLH